MLNELRQRLAGVYRRERRLRLVEGTVSGLFLGSLVAVVLALLWRFDLGPVWWSPWVALGAGAIVGALAALISRITWEAAAGRVDNHYDLKDRSLTALQFAAENDPDPVRELQLKDALSRLDQVDPVSVLPWKKPRCFVPVLGSCAVLALAMFIPVPQPVVASVPVETREVLEDQADHLEETMLEDLKELAKEDEENEEVDKLLKDLEELVEELREPESDERDALAQLSKMQQSIAASMAAFNLEQVDAAMQSVAGSMAAATAMQQVAKDLKEGEYEKAAGELEKFDPDKLSNKERRAVSDNLKKLSDELANKKLGQLSECTGSLSEGLKKKNKSQCQGAACKLARLCRQQALRKSTSQCLSKQLNSLSMCKKACSNCNKNGGNKVAKSNSPSNNWGTGKSKNPLGDSATNIDSQRDQINVSGKHGEGPSEKETLTTTEAKQVASRGYQEKYQEYRKQAESVLENEPLPLGHRQMVKQYFENIRPQNPESE